MKLHLWRSEAMKEYGEGYIVAMGNDVDEARANAMVSYVFYLRERYSYYYNEHGAIEDEYDRRTIEDYLAKFQADVTKEPEIMPYNSIVIPGSE